MCIFFAKSSFPWSIRKNNLSHTMSQHAETRATSATHAPSALYIVDSLSTKDVTTHHTSRKKRLASNNQSSDSPNPSPRITNDETRRYYSNDLILTDDRLSALHVTSHDIIALERGFRVPLIRIGTTTLTTGTKIGPAR